MLARRQKLQKGSWDIFVQNISAHYNTHSFSQCNKFQICITTTDLAPELQTHVPVNWTSFLSTSLPKYTLSKMGLTSYPQILLLSVNITFIPSWISPENSTHFADTSSLIHQAPPDFIYSVYLWSIPDSHALFPISPFPNVPLFLHCTPNNTSSVTLPILDYHS